MKFYHYIFTGVIVITMLDMGTGINFSTVRMHWHLCSGITDVFRNRFILLKGRSVGTNKSANKGTRTITNLSTIIHSFSNYTTNRRYTIISLVREPFNKYTVLSSICYRREFPISQDGTVRQNTKLRIIE